MIWNTCYTNRYRRGVIICIYCELKILTKSNKLNQHISQEKDKKKSADVSFNNNTPNATNTNRNNSKGQTKWPNSKYNWDLLISWTRRADIGAKSNIAPLRVKLSGGLKWAWCWWCRDSWIAFVLSLHFLQDILAILVNSKVLNCDFEIFSAVEDRMFHKICSLWPFTCHMLSEKLVRTGSGNGLLPHNQSQCWPTIYKSCDIHLMAFLQRFFTRITVASPRQRPMS